MKQFVKIALIPILVFSLVSIQARTGEAEETAGQTLAKLEKLSPDKRQKALLKGAKAEGEITWYSSIQAYQITKIANAFSKKYPFLKFNRYRVSGQKQIFKIQSEARAKRYSVDVVNGNSEGSYTLKQLGLIDPYRTPQRKFYDESYRDKEGYFTPTYVIPVLFAHNTGLLKAGEIPKSYNDMLKPKWKGQFLLDTEEFPMYFVLRRHWGVEKARKYLKQLAKQDPRLQRGRTSQLQLLLAGERPLALALHGHSVLDLKSKGAPVDWTTLDPFFAKANMTMLAKNAPHPYAAALFMDWLLSDKGQSVITTFGRVSAHGKVKQKFPEMVKDKYFLVTPDEIGPTISEVQKEYRELILK